MGRHSGVRLSQPVRTHGEKPQKPLYYGILPAHWDKLVAAELFEKDDKSDYILTAKGRRYADAGKLPKIEGLTT